MSKVRGGVRILARGETEKAPPDNHKGWRTECEVLNGSGKTTIFVTVWEWPDGRPCEIFITSSRSGSKDDQYLQVIGKMCSRLLQHGMTLEKLVEKLLGEPGPLGGLTTNESIKSVDSVQDLLAKLLQKRYGVVTPADTVH